MSSREKVLAIMDCGNGEIRIMAARYEHPHWYCMLSFQELPDHLWELWEDLVGGDNDYFEARDMLFGDESGNFVIARGSTPEIAMEEAFLKAVQAL